MLRRVAVIGLLTAALVAGGLAGPAPAADLVPPTAMERVDGLPPATDKASLDASVPAPAEGGARVDALAAAAAVPSAQVRMPIRFSMVGFVLPPDTEVGFRTSADGRGWSEWTWAPALWPDDGPDPGTAEGQAAPPPQWFTAPHWTGDAAWLQLRVLGPAGPAEVGVELIDTLGVSRPWWSRTADAVRAAWRGPAPAVAGEQPTPGIVSRAEWGANESWRKTGPSYSRRARVGVVHHTATRNNYSPEEGPALVRGFYAYHTQTQGWNDIGYNLLIDRYGTVYEGRYGGVEDPVIGAHSGGFNTSTFGVSVIGSFEDSAPPAAAVDKLVDVLAWKFDVHHLDVTSSYTLTSGGSTRYSTGTRVTLPTLIGHRDVSATACPGAAFYTLLPAIRDRVLAKGGSMLLDHDASPSAVTIVDGTSVDGAITFSARLRPAGSWQLEVRDPGGAVVHTAGGDGTEARASWTPAGARPGRYTYTFSSPGRRPAADWVELNPPVIRNASASTDLASYRSDGQLISPVTISADLWPNASWEITVESPSGATVLSQRGTGARAQVSWSGSASESGQYRWKITAAEAEPASGTLEMVRTMLDRVGGGESVTSVLRIAQAAFPTARSATHAVIARSDVFADAMAGGPLAGTDGPVLLTGGDRLDSRVSAELERVLAEGATVYVLGGTEALSDAVEQELRSGWDVKRLSGRTRVETAAAVAGEVVADSGVTTALIARGWPDDKAPWADALSGGAYGAAHGIPVLLTETNQLSGGTLRALSQLGITHTLVLGGTAAVADSVLDTLPRSQRVYGSDRAATATAVARELWGRRSGAGGDRFVLSPGYRSDAWQLALAAAPLAARAHAPLLLAEADNLPQATGVYLQSLGYGGGKEATGFVLGGDSDLSDAVVLAASRHMQ